MSSTRSKELPDDCISGLNFEDTELRLSLPGQQQRRLNFRRNPSLQDSFSLNLGSSTFGKNIQKNCPDCSFQNQTPNGATLPAKILNMERRKFVKVGVDGAPFLRKVDLEMYSSYQQLLAAVENMFSLSTICNVPKQMKLMDPANAMLYVPTYEDEDGDWMLVGDIPWKSFVESCKRIRLMENSQTTGQTMRTFTNCSRTSC